MLHYVTKSTVFMVRIEALQNMVCNRNKLPRNTQIKSHFHILCSGVFQTLTRYFCCLILTELNLNQKVWMLCFLRHVMCLLFISCCEIRLVSSYLINHFPLFPQLNNGESHLGFFVLLKCHFERIMEPKDLL